MSVGHTARVLEERGISTVVVYIRAFRHQAVNLKVPRAVVTPNILGRTVGKVGDSQGQRRVVIEALRLLEQAQAPGAIVDLQEG
ncbi:MAG: hypothetical protein HY681_03315 [Chloroflexi bacterium]|nr:hypothetical protein [Chloroflexota bacterium]